MAVALIALSAVGAGCDLDLGEEVPERQGTGEVRAGWVSHGAPHFIVRYPETWRRAKRSLTPRLVSPREVLTLGTGPLPSGGRCGQFPARALNHMRNEDALISLQERRSGEGFPARPPSFGTDDLENTVNEHVIAQRCTPSHDPYEAGMLAFRDGGRGYSVLVAVGREAPLAVRREAARILTGIRFRR